MGAGKAQDDSPYNDSFFVQFSDSVNEGGGAVSRIGTTGAEVINLEDCSGCGLSNWGWQDNGWGVGVLGPLIYFQNSGAAYDPDPLPGRWLVAGSVGAVTNDLSEYGARSLTQ